MRSAVTFVFLAMMAVVAHGQGALIATLTNPVTTPGFIPTAAGLNILGPISNTANLAGALSSSLGLGTSVASGIGSIGASTAVTALTVLAAYEQKMNTLKALSAEILNAEAQIANAIRADVTNTALNWIFTPLSAVQPIVAKMTGLLSIEFAVIGRALAGVTRLAGDAVAGVSALFQAAARFAAMAVKAPAAVAQGVLNGCLGAVTALQGLAALATPALIGNKALQAALGIFKVNLAVTQGTLMTLSRLLTGWQGFDAAVVATVTNVMKGFAGAAGAGLASLLG